jgi:hypothetical protein
MTEQTWATLDEANKTHYSRYPTAIVDARKAWQDAAQAHTEIADLWERGAATNDDLAEAWDVYLICLNRYNAIYDAWMQGTLAEQVLDTIVEAHYQDAEHAEDAELWRVGQGG